MTAKELEEWFEGRELPKGSVKINKFSTIGNLRTAVDADLTILKYNTTPKMTEPAILRLIEIKEWVENQ